MSMHTLTAYLKYKWTAQNRHGVHSPSAYAFVEDVIENRGALSTNNEAQKSLLAEGKYNTLLNRTMAYYGYRTVADLTTGKPDDRQQYDVLMLPAGEPAQWVQLLNRYSALLNNDSMVVVAGIHKTAGHTAAWQLLCDTEIVRMSFDLYGLGLLFFRKEFKERQHFVFRY